jgi:hypothetical protein
VMEPYEPSLWLDGIQFRRLGAYSRGTITVGGFAPHLVYEK